MNTKSWAVFFVFLFSSEYVLVAAASVVRHKRQSGGHCKPTPKLEELFNKCFEDAKAEMPDELELLSHPTGNPQLHGEFAKGLTNFRRAGPVRCVCHQNFVRVFLLINFMDLTFDFIVTLLDYRLGGPMGTALNRLLDQVGNLVVNLVAPEINVVIAVDQRFEPGTKCSVMRYRVTRISDIKVLNIDLTQLVVGLLDEVLIPVVEVLIKNLMHTQVRAILTNQIQKLTITPDMYSC